MKGLNIRHLLIIAVGYNEYLHDEIEKVYEKKRWEYYRTFKESGFYDDVIIKSFSPIRSEKMKHVAGIVEWCYNNQDFSLINQFITKGYKNAIRYYEQHKRYLDIQDFTRYICKRKDVQLHDISETELIMNHIILMYLCYKDNQDINKIFSTPFGGFVIEGIKNLFIELGYRALILEDILKSDTKQEEISQFIKETIGIDINKKFPGIVDNFIDHILDIGTSRVLEQKGMKKEKASVETLGEIRTGLYEKGIYRHIGNYAAMLKLTQLNLSDLLNIEITKEDLMLYAQNAMTRIHENNYTEEEIQQFFIASIYNHAIIAQYKRQKDTLFDDSVEAWYLEVKNQEENLKNKELFYEKMKSNLEQTVHETKTKNNQLQEENSSLKKEIARLQAEMEAFQEDKNELIELRNFVYNQKKLDIVYDTVDVSEMVSTLNKHKLIVCGGHENLQKKLKELIPNIELLDTDNLGKNFSFLANYKVIYYYPNYANHSFYKKIKTAIKNSSTQLVYLPDIDNVEKIVMEMYENLHDNV